MSSQLQLSVVVPVRDGAATLTRTLRAILASELPRHEFELIVVDDSSQDGSAAIAARYADTVIRLTGRTSGFAYARNRGAEIARADAVAFVDSDIMVRADTLPRMLKALHDHPGLGAISASHDSMPAAPNFLSQYWNLLLHFGETWHEGIGGNFGSGCGMLRRSALISGGMYDEWRFGTGTLEGVELGQRLRRAGHDVLLSADLPVTHLKRWGPGSVVREAWSRSALLSRSLGYQRTRSSVPSDVVFTLTRTSIPTLTVVCIVALSAAFLPKPDMALTTVAALALVMLANFGVLRRFAHERGILFAIGVAPVHFFFELVSAAGLCAGWLMRDVLGDKMPDAATQAYAEVGLEIWPPVPRPK